MKLSNLKSSIRMALAIATLTPAAALAHIDLDASQWQRAELLWSEFVGDYLAQPSLGDDPFQERLVWSDAHGDYIPAGMARTETAKVQHDPMVWSDAHGDYLPRDVLDPCPSVAERASVQVVGLF